MNKLSVFLISAFLVFIVAPSVMAAKPAGGDNVVPSTTLGIDVSYPQCGKTLPSSYAFGIVGVNGGNAATTNTCMAEQLGWANRSTGAALSQPKLQLYVNTGNPGEVIAQAVAWPTTNTDRNSYVPNNPYGPCTGGNTIQCSWQYGWDRALEAVINRFTPAAAAAKIDSSPSRYVWWLDVETMNTWQSGSPDALKRNVATLEGMTSYYKYRGVTTVGLYSTAVQWKEITGNYISSASNLNGLNNWRPGGASLSTAKQACTAKPLTTNGKVVLTQYISKGLDYDYSCV